MLLLLLTQLQPFLSLWKPDILWRGVLYAMLMCVGKLAVGVPIVIWTLLSPSDNNPTPQREAQLPPAPRPARPTARERLRASLYPATFIGVAMVSRGEIGLLIAQIARASAGSSSRGAPRDDSGLLSEEGFLACIWAILLCTLVGPVGVGMVVRKYRHDITAGIWA